MRALPYVAVFSLLLSSSLFAQRPARGGIPSPSSFASKYNCHPDAAKHTSQDPQGYARMFFIAYCQCTETGVSSPESERQMIAQMQSMKQAYNTMMSDATPDIKVTVPSQCKRANAAAGAAGSGEMTEQQKLEQTIQNYANALNIVNQARQRAAQTAEALKNYNSISSNGNPYDIMDQFQRNMDAIQNIDQDLRESINMGYIENTTNVISDYNSGNQEGAFYGGVATLASIYDNQEAKKEVELQRQQLIQEKQRALEDAANRMIEANNAAIARWVNAAAFVLEEDKEKYYMEMAFYHSSYAHSISNNFNYNNVDWAKDYFGRPQEPVYKTYYGPLAEQHYEASLRKHELYKEHSRRVLYDGAIQHIATAIDMQPDEVSYYIAQGRIANPTDMVLSLSNYVAAYDIDPDYFDEALNAEFTAVYQLANDEVRIAIETGNSERIRDYIDAGLYDVVSINDGTLFEYAAQVNAVSSLEVIYERYIRRLENDRLKDDYIRQAIATSAVYGSNNALQFLFQLGYDSDFTFYGKTPVDYAFDGQDTETFLLAFMQSNNKPQHIARYGQSAVFITALSRTNPEIAAEGLESITSPEKKAGVIMTLVSDLPQQPRYLATLNLSPSAKTMMISDEKLRKTTFSVFLKMILDPAGENTAAALINDRLVDDNLILENAADVTSIVILSDQVTTYRILKSRGLLSATNPDGDPIQFDFVRNGTKILRSEASSMNFQVQTQDGIWLVHELALSNVPENRDFLINGGKVNINRQGLYGWTPLHYAARQNDTQLVRILLAAGADKNIKDKWGRRPLNIAREREFDEIKTVLSAR